MSSPTNKSSAILFIEPQPFLTNRGSPFRAMATVKALAELGYEVDLLVYPLGENVDIPGVKIHRCGKVPWIDRVKIGPSWAKLVLDGFLFFKALSLVRRRRYVLIHGIEESVLVGLILGRWFKIPYIMDMHSCMPEQLAEHRLLGGRLSMKFFYWFEAFCARHAAGVQTVSDMITRRSQGLAPGVPAVTVEDIALDSSGSVNPELVKSVRGEFGLAGKRVVVYTGNLAPYQGVELLVDAFGRMQTLPGAAAFKDDSVLLIVGGGPEVDSRMAELRSLADKWGVSERVVFAGERSGEEMGSFMAVADVLASPRMFGNHTPLKIYSYMVSGKPIAATRIASHTNVLDDECAFLGEPSTEGYAAALAAALDPAGKAKAASVAACAKERVDKRFSRKQFVAKVGLLYRQALGEEADALRRGMAPGAVELEKE